MLGFSSEALSRLSQVYLRNVPHWQTLIVDSHHEIVERKSGAEVERPEEKVRHLLDIAMITPFIQHSNLGSLSECGYETEGKMRFFCYFRHWNDVTIKGSNTLPRLMETWLALTQAEVLKACIFFLDFTTYP